MTVKTEWWNMSKYAFFLGCIAPARALNYDASTRKVAEVFDIELIDLEGFACCGFPIWAIDQNTSLAMAARNLSVAEENNLDILTICSACSFALTKTNKRIQENNELKEKTPYFHQRFNISVRQDYVQKRFINRAINMINGVLPDL